MRKEDLDRLWEDPENWNLWGIYRCPSDPRVLVPKRVKWTGWTLNFAHPRAFLVLVLFLAIALVPTFLVVALGWMTSTRNILLAVLPSVVGVVATAVFISSRTRG